MELLTFDFRMPEVTDGRRDFRQMRAWTSDGTIAHMMQPLLAVHIAAGSIALASMLIPMVTRKGGRAHRRAGWVFVSSMGVVSVTALALSAARILFDPRPQARDFGFFLLVVALLTGSAVSAGVRVLRFRDRSTARLHWWDTGLPALLGAASVGLGSYGLARGQILFVAFGGIGLLTAAGSLRYWLRPPRLRMHWWFEHMTSMLTGCIAAITAFMVTTGGNFGIWPLAAWLGPSIIGVPAIALWTRYYQRLFTAHASTEGTSPTTTGRAPGTLARIARA
jgi:uncharacterized membrane protein